MEKPEQSTTMKARKVNYDDFSGTFSIETRLQALKRQIVSHSKLVNVLNKSQDAKLRYTAKKALESSNIVCRRLDKEGQFYRQVLRDRLAYLEILREFAQRETQSDDVTYSGLYDLGLSRKDLQEMIEEKIKDSTPSARRQKLCRQLLSRRRLVPVFDRTKSTSALLRMREHIISRPTTDQPVTSDSPVPRYSPKVRAARLVLPPITVSVAVEKSKKSDSGAGRKLGVNGGSFFLTDQAGVKTEHSQNKLPQILQQE